MSWHLRLTSVSSSQICEGIGGKKRAAASARPCGWSVMDDVAENSQPRPEFPPTQVMQQIWMLDAFHIWRSGFGSDLIWILGSGAASCRALTAAADQRPQNGSLILCVARCALLVCPLMDLLGCLVTISWQ